MAIRNDPPIINIEVSDFDPAGYLVKIGVALDGQDRFCTLIHPAP